MMMAPMNVKVLGADNAMYKDNGGGPPPYVMIKKVPTEKLEPQGDGNEGHGFRRPGPPGVEMLPTMTMPGIPGPPTRPLPPNSRPATQMDMMNMSMRSGMPPSMPFGGPFGGGMPGSFGPGAMPTPPGSFVGAPMGTMPPGS